ncbi:hypothetical protein HDV05_004642 [Chytridiales sp. JEL 0842]|nr:hypothetical protein HDV05_004642 [Chytridiales sp. JEL 0842]
MAAPLTPPFVSNDCLYIDEKTPCGVELYGYPVHTQAFANYTFFSEEIARASNPTTLAARFTRFGCVNGPDLVAALERVRYLPTYWCTSNILYGLAGFNNLTACPAPSGAEGNKRFGPLMCQAQCDQTSKALIDVLNNPQLCPTLNNDGVGRAQLYARYCTDMGARVAENGGCINSLQTEVPFCGFKDEATARQGCVGLNTDSCCTNLLAAASRPPTAPPTNGSTTPGGTITPVTPPSTSANSSNGNGNGSNMGPIIGGVVGGIIAVALAIGILMYLRNKSKPRKSNGVLPTSSSSKHGSYNTQLDPSSNSVSTKGSFGLLNPVSKSSLPRTSPALVAAAAAITTTEKSPSPPPKSTPPPPTYDTTVRDSVVPTSSSSETLLRIIHPYTPTLADELTLEVGADVILLKSFDDGWALGMNPTTGIQGAFPLVCVCKPEELEAKRGSMASNGERISKRISSVSGHLEYMKGQGYDPSLDADLGAGGSGGGVRDSVATTVI